MSQKEQLCKTKLLILRDALEVIQGKWRLPIVISLTHGNKRFGEIQRDIEDISPKMLSQELKALEANKIITRTLYDSMPVTVEYSLTELGKTMDKMLDEILNWGAHFRTEILSNRNQKV
ncbi:winged helix-turn-helix transcriptional regulator [Frigoriflavimonas asaccharolytica]|uniref:DNA-binding HxlR family transcriptional regulator n=1 Tax=Frigoriflavimonas asaccharolytica TaxID=2735899 RepID=A0A8J8GCW6_9FLAO|nr:helix-turn-helix domain-containing protein [Frigoriflavimonas asaccharolytica]NRS93427.1 DNA-binding HxlR family transcriptional regulator [Frigoriflavimonas asaccharolytica]